MTGADLRGLFAPRAIALVGATDKSRWSLYTYANLHAFGQSAPVHVVSPHASVVHGQRAVAHLADLEGPVDLAYVMVPTNAVLPVLEEAWSAGIGHAVVLTAGFGEIGGAGREREQALVDFVDRTGMVVLGPNGNGFVNATDGIAAYGLPVPPPLIAGGVGVVLQSGALASAVLNLAQTRNVGISLLVSMGNEATVRVADVVDYLVDDPDTRAIALFLESVRDTASFVRVGRRALAAGKPLVVLKTGRSQAGARVALAHTGSLVGDDRVVDAALHQLGAIRVRSLEDLLNTAGLLASTGPLPGRRLGVVTPSGGACDIIADRAEDEGLSLPEFAPATVERLASICPPFATVQNPLDVTGYVVVDRTLLGRALEVAVDDPGTDVTICLTEPPRVAPPDVEPVLDTYGLVGSVAAKAPHPVLLMSNAGTDVTAFSREVAERTGLPFVAGGIEHGLTALGRAAWWSERARAGVPAPVSVPSEPVELHREPVGVWSERDALALLSSAGVPVVPTVLARSAAEAADAASRLGLPAVVKVAGDLAHKSDVGGVALGLSSPSEVAAAYERVVAAGHGAGATVEGALVAPMRSGGVELLVGVVRDPQWGPVLAVGLGGVWVEVLRDTALRLLPVGRADVEEMLSSLRGAALLDGARGQAALDRVAVVDAVLGIATLAGRLGDRLVSLEVNPLLARPDGAEALDALVVWQDG